MNKPIQKPNFEEMIERLEEYSQNLKENSQIGNSKLILAFVEMIRAMGWSSSQQDTNNIQIANLIGEVKTLKDITDTGAQTSARSELISNRLAWIAIGIALFSSGFTAWNAFLANQSVQLATQPQINYYLMPPDATSSDQYIFGIENTGTVPINNLNVSYAEVTLYKNGCVPTSLEVTCGGSVAKWMGNVFTNSVAATPLMPQQSRTVPILVGNAQNASFIHGLDITISYDRQTDQQRTTKELDYIIDGYKIYTLDNAKDIPAMAPYIAAFREFSVDTSLGLRGYKIYWK